jgi:ABC-type amino acid transport system permease subunit
MNALVVGGVVFVSVFGGALLGMYLRSVLPEHHFSADSKDIIRVSMAMIATLAALVVGLLIASAKSSFDNKDSELTRVAASYVLLDRTMAEYGPETRESRDLLRQTLATKLHQIWPEGDAEKLNPKAVSQGRGVEAIQRKLLDLSPQNDAQRWLKSTALQLSSDIAELRWSAVEQMGSSIQWPFLTIMVFWFAVIFVSFGLFAPPNGSVIVVLLVCALSLAGSIYLIVEMDQPYGGFIMISSEPFVTALDQLGR